MLWIVCRTMGGTWTERLQTSSRSRECYHVMRSCDVGKVLAWATRFHTVTLGSLRNQRTLSSWKVNDIRVSKVTLHTRSIYLHWAGLLYPRTISVSIYTFLPPRVFQKLRAVENDTKSARRRQGWRTGGIFRDGRYPGCKHEATTDATMRRDNVCPTTRLIFRESLNVEVPTHSRVYISF